MPGLPVHFSSCNGPPEPEPPRPTHRPEATRTRASPTVAAVREEGGPFLEVLGEPRTGPLARPGGRRAAHAGQQVRPPGVLGSGTPGDGPVGTGEGLGGEVLGGGQVPAARARVGEYRGMVAGEHLVHHVTDLGVGNRAVPTQQGAGFPVAQASERLLTGGTRCAQHVLPRALLMTRPLTSGRIRHEGATLRPTGIRANAHPRRAASKRAVPGAMHGRRRSARVRPPVRPGRTGPASQLRPDAPSCINHPVAPAC